MVGELFSLVDGGEGDSVFGFIILGVVEGKDDFVIVDIDMTDEGLNQFDLAGAG